MRFKVLHVREKNLLLDFERWDVLSLVQTDIVLSFLFVSFCFTLNFILDYILQF